jgi:hypothetical protein
MSILKRHLAEHELRLVLIEEICIDKRALVYDIDSDEVFFRGRRGRQARLRSGVSDMSERND